jgi:hypothetical protein
MKSTSTSARRNARIKNNSGILEKWNIGITGKQLKPLNPIFHFSNIPIFHVLKVYAQTKD